MVEKLSDVKKTYTSAEFIVSDSNGVRNKVAGEFPV